MTTLQIDALCDEVDKLRALLADANSVLRSTAEIAHGEMDQPGSTNWVHTQTHEGAGRSAH